MQTFLSVFLLLCLAACATANRPRPCRSPPLLQGSVTVATQRETFWAFSKFAYDGIGRRIRVGEFGTYHNQTFFKDFLLLYQEGVAYDIDTVNKSCIKRRLRNSFHPFGIPENFSFLNQIIVGSSSGIGEGLLINNWQLLSPETNEQTLLSYTEFGCIPVSTLYHSPKTGWVTMSFMNNLRGIDPELLIVPAFCEDAPMEQNGEPVDFFSIFT